MLYVTTLDRTVTYTAQATLERATGPDGGLFVPMTLPQYDRKGLAALVALPFWECVAAVSYTHLQANSLKRILPMADLRPPGGQALRGVDLNHVKSRLLAGGMLAEPQPVSYTHLDVYKRQAPR